MTQKQGHIEPDVDFSWLEDDANKANKLFASQNVKTMKLINYKESHFNLIIEKDHPLFPKTVTPNTTTKDRCKHCQKTFSSQNMIKHMDNCHKEKIEKSEDVSRNDTINVLKKIVKSLELHLKESEEKRKKAIID